MTMIPSISHFASGPLYLTTQASAFANTIDPARSEVRSSHPTYPIHPTGTAPVDCTGLSAVHACGPPKDHEHMKWLRRMDLGTTHLLSHEELRKAQSASSQVELARYQTLLPFRQLSKFAERVYSTFSSNDHFLADPTSANKIKDQSMRILNALAPAPWQDDGSDMISMSSKVRKEGRDLEGLMSTMIMDEARGAKIDLAALARQFESTTDSFIRSMGSQP